MEAFEEVADTFSNGECCNDFFSTRLSTLSLSFTSSFDPAAFSFDTSSRSSSLRHCESTAGSTATDGLAPAQPVLPAVTATPCGSSGRHVVLARRSSLPSGRELHTRTSTSGWPSQPSRPGLVTETPQPASAGAPAIATGTSVSAHATCAAAPHAGAKRRSCAEASDVSGVPLSKEHPGQQQQQRRPGSMGGAAELSSGPARPAEPSSPSSSFASFAAALAAHYFADYGSVPDVPTHLEEMRQRGSKRQRVLSADGAADG